MRCWIAVVATLVLATCAKSEDKSEAPETKEPGRPQEARPDPPAAPPASPLSWMTDESAALARAKKENKRVLIDFGAKWCLPCLEFERRTFTDAAVIGRLSDMVLLRFDVTDQSEANDALQKRYKVEMLPALLVLSPAGDEEMRITEFLEPKPFLAELAKLATLD